MSLKWSIWSQEWNKNTTRRKVTSCTACVHLSCLSVQALGINRLWYVGVTKFLWRPLLHTIAFKWTCLLWEGRPYLADNRKRWHKASFLQRFFHLNYSDIKTPNTPGLDFKLWTLFGGIFFNITFLDQKKINAIHCHSLRLSRVFCETITHHLTS